jgi:hypothetical protein
MHWRTTAKSAVPVAALHFRWATGFLFPTLLPHVEVAARHIEHSMGRDFIRLRLGRHLRRLQTAHSDRDREHAAQAFESWIKDQRLYL